MATTRILLMFAILACSLIARGAEFSSPPPGEYITNGGGGSLVVKRNKQGVLSFDLDVVGTNAHTCGLGGKIIDGVSILETSGIDDDFTKTCLVQFKKVAEGFILTAAGDMRECRAFCGARAWFEDLYVEPPANCKKNARRDARNQFKRLYQNKRYTEALAVLDSVLRECEPIMSWLEAGWIRNDVAITQFKLSDLTACHRTLQPLAFDAQETDDDIRENFAPSDAESYIPILHATRTNLKLCKANFKNCIKSARVCPS